MDIKTVILAILAFIFTLILILLVAVWNDVLPLKPQKPVIEKTWFGPGKEVMQSSDIQPFEINVSNEVSRFMNLLGSVCFKYLNTYVLHFLLICKIPEKVI